MKIIELLLVIVFIIFFSENIYSQSILLTDRSEAQTVRYTSKKDVVSKVKDNIEIKQGRDNDSEDDERDKTLPAESDSLNLKKSEFVPKNKEKVTKRKSATN